jgi:putative restriction endonuclease
MPGYWWVNHKQTVRQEIGGQYLWSPKTNRNGARNVSYDNMREANPGDLVLSYANGRIAWIGRVVDFAFTSPKPEEFGNAGANWKDEGWLLPVFWTPLTPAIVPRTLIDRLGPLLPERYSPISPTTGHGNQAIYLAKISEPVFRTLIGAGDYDAQALARGGENSLSYEIVTEQLNDIVEDRIASDRTLDDTTRRAMIQARRGQGVFRRNVEAIDPACRLTGITNPLLLKASHIKPWRLCQTAAERLDGWNGLMLTPDADHLFDRGFITFEDDGNVKVSQRVSDEELRRLGFGHLVQQRFGLAEAPAIWPTGEFRPQQQAYLDYHRTAVYVH